MAQMQCGMGQSSEWQQAYEAGLKPQAALKQLLAR